MCVWRLFCMRAFGHESGVVRGCVCLVVCGVGIRGVDFGVVAIIVFVGAVVGLVVVVGRVGVYGVFGARGLVQRRPVWPLSACFLAGVFVYFVVGDVVVVACLCVPACVFVCVGVCLCVFVVGACVCC